MISYLSEVLVIPESYLEYAVFSTAFLFTGIFVYVMVNFCFSDVGRQVVLLVSFLTAMKERMCAFFRISEPVSYIHNFLKQQG